MKRFAWLTLALIATSASAESIRRVQHPTLSPDGTTLVFSWQGDLWRVSREGGRAERLTVHPAPDLWPRYTPDGSRIVFGSSRFGSQDLFSISPDGTDLRRHTFDSATEVPAAVSPDGKTVYGHTSAWGRSDLFKVDLHGGEMIRLTDHYFETEYTPSISPDGRKVYYNRGSYGPTSWRKPGVIGRAVGDLWVADNTVPLRNHRNLTKSDWNELAPVELPNGELLYQSNKGGWPNLFRGDKQLTRHQDGTLRNPQVSANGRWVAYEFNSDLWTFDLQTGQNRKLEIQVPSDARFNPVADLTITTGVARYDVAPDGKRTVLNLRGDLFLIPERGGTTRRLTQNIAWDGNPAWVDAKTIVFSSAESDGKRTLKTVDIQGAIKPFLTHELDLTHPTLSPDGKMIAFHRGITEICVVPVGGGEAKVVAKGNFADALDGDRSFNWSPDNAWLAVAMPTDRGANVELVPLDGKPAITAARLPRFVSAPAFLPNGRSIYFIASDVENAELFVVDLLPSDVTFTEDDLDKIDAPKPADPKSVKVEVYAPWIERRLRRLTSTGASAPVASSDSRTIWANVDGQFSAVPVRGGAISPVSGVTGSIREPLLAKNGQKLYLINATGFAALNLQGPGSLSPISFSAQYQVNLREEEMALFNEIGWAMDRLYYDEKLHGKNWAGIRAKFARVVPFVTDRSDFYALMGEMMEELDSSHLGATAPPTPPFGNDSTGYLGVDFDPTALATRGTYVITRVVDGSPASQPGSLLKVGDRLLSVNGQALNRENPFAKLFNRTSGRKVALEIERAGRKLNLEIKPDSSGQRANLEYEAYVEWQRATIDRLSQGRVSYFHIEGMNAPAYDRFLREIRTFTPGKEAAIVDVRFNGGGNTAHQVLGVMMKRPWLIRTTRGERGIRISENIFRGDSLELPSAMMINQASYSNAEVIAEGFRKLGLGPLIGERTPGYVIGTGGYTLWDGGFIRMPSIGAFAVNGENLENNGRKPDFDVPFDPDAWMAGRDPQTERAVQEVMRRLK